MKPKPSPLQLATAARVACAMLEGQLNRRAYKKAAATNRQLWHRIDAMAARIEDQVAEIERLQMPNALPTIVLESEQSMRQMSDTRIQPVDDWAGDETRSDTADTRPPGFDRVRRTLRHQPLHRENPCATIVLPEDRPLPPKKKAMRAIDWKNGAQRSSAPPWRRVVSAYLDGQLVAGETYSKGALRRICGLSSNVLEGVQMDLAEHRAPVRLIDRGNSVYVRAA